MRHCTSWIAVDGFNVNVAFWLDPLSAVMILVITGVGTLIHIYAVGYMEHEKDYARFFIAMNLFVFAMLMLVLADNYLLMFLGWEGVGVCSYLLIGFWFDRDNISVGTDEKFLSPRSSATKAFVVNRIGDFGFTLGIILMFWTFGSLEFDKVFPQAANFVYRRRTRNYDYDAAVVFGRDGQIRTDSAVYLAARCDGRSDARERVDSCGDDGDGGCLYGGAVRMSCMSLRRRR